MSAFTFDDSKYPLIVAKFPKDATEAECRQYSYDVAKLCRKYEKNILWLVDTRASGADLIIQKSKRDAMAESFREIEELFDSAVIARAHLVTNKFAEHALTAFFWLLKKQAKSPKKFFTDYNEAVAWLMAHKDQPVQNWEDSIK